MGATVDKQLRYVVTATDKGAGKTIADVGAKGEAASKRLSEGFGRAGRFIGGEVSEAFYRAGDVIDTFGEKGRTAGQKIAGVGAAVAGAGFLLSKMGASEKQASDQLQVAIDNTGKDVEGLNEKIEHAVKHMEKYGDTAVQTKGALTTLTNATHDPEKALTLLGTAADVAAVKHVSLNDAAAMLGKGLNGSAKVFKQFGVEVKKNADGTKDYAGAIQQLAQVVHGQADASANNLNGTLRHLRAEVEDGVAAFGQKYGPAITGAGVAMMVLGPVVGKLGPIIRSMGSAFTTTAVEAEAGAAGIAGANATTAATTTATASEVAAAETTIQASNARTAASFRMLGIGVGAGIGALGTAALVLPSVTGEQINASGQLVNAYKAVTHSTDTSAAAILNWASTTNDARGQVIPVADVLKDLKINSDQLAAGVSGADSEFAKFRDGLAAHAHLSQVDKEALQLLHKEFANTAPTVDDATKALNDNAAAAGPLIAGYGATQDAVDKVSASITKSDESLAAQTLQMQLTNDAAGLLTQGFKKLNDGAMGAEHASNAFKAAEESLDSAVKQGGRSLNDNTHAGRQNVDAMLAGVQAAQAHAEAVAKQTGRVRQGQAVFNQDIETLRKHAYSLGFNKDQVDALIKKYGGLPPEKLTKVDLQDMASGGIANIEAELRSMDGMTSYVNVVERRFGTGAGMLSANAGGNDFFAGGRTHIAEREPEIVDLPRGTKITPVSKMKFSTGSGSAVPVNVHLYVQTLTTDAASQRALVSALEGAIQTGLKIRGLSDAAA